MKKITLLCFTMMLICWGGYATSSFAASSCPPASLKGDPGICGCDIADEDGNNDGITDCLLQPGVTNIRQFLVVSDGSHSLGDSDLEFNNTRDQGSKIVYFNAENGDNSSAEVYWWNGTHIVDSNGSTANPDNNQIYGTDPLTPNEAAIKPFKELISSGDSRLRTQTKVSSSFLYDWRTSSLAGAYPDWFLFRRGQAHSNFDVGFSGGRSEKDPMVVSAYGPLSEGRAIIAPDENSSNPVSGSPKDKDDEGNPRAWHHVVLFSLELRARLSHYGGHRAYTHAQGGGPITEFIEDCYWPGINQGNITYPVTKTTIRRSVITNSYNAGSHNQGFYTSDFENQVTFDEVIFFKNGFKTNPVTDPDPKRTIFDRNVYQGGGAKMGFTYLNVISADGGSGGPQMRLGGLIENSLVIEGYFYSSTKSNLTKVKNAEGVVIKEFYENDWLLEDGQVGTSAIVRNNVQLIYGYPSDNDPDTLGSSSTAAQPSHGYSLGGENFGALVEGNIISGAMLRDELSTSNKLGRHGLGLDFVKTPYNDYDKYTQQGQEDTIYTQKNNTIRNNIFYGVTRGLNIYGDAELTENMSVTDNVVVATTPTYGTLTNISSSDQLLVDNNRFYSDEALPSGIWFGEGNTLSDYLDAKSSEGWIDPDRTLKRYVTEILGLTLLDWTDNPYLDPDAKQIRIDNKEIYDPAGINTFMSVATNMRYGGSDEIPSSGKPDMTADYPWDKRFTAVAVVNWIREGFNLAPVGSVGCGDITGDQNVDLKDLISGLRLLTGDEIFPSPYADCNGDRKIDMTEVLNIANHMK